MAFLLGGESCIESLRSDLSDIQETINDIISRIGFVKCYSWKYPDKIATDIKLDELLDRYKFGEDEVDNQVAHYSLLEILIDRLLLLVHLSSFQIEKSLTPTTTDAKTTNKPPNGQTITSNLSAGLTVKKYWSKFTHICTTVRQLHCQNKTLSQKQQLSDRPSSKLSIASKNDSNRNEVSNEISNKSTQTLETAFVPCESCAKVQNNLKLSADVILNMCHYQNIPSNLGKFRSSLTNQTIGWLNSTDIERWLLEQEKDLNKLSKQLEYWTKNSELMKDKWQDSENNLAKLVTNEKDMKKSIKDEQEIRTTMMKQYERKLADQKLELNLQFKSLDDDYKNLKQIKENLESQIANLESIKIENERIINELNENNTILSKENNMKLSEKEKTAKIEQEKALLNVELECLKREMNEKTKELGKERTKIENMIRHEQSLQMKQESLLKSMEQISEECEELKNKLNSIEEDSFDSKHKDLLDKLGIKEETLKALENENNTLNTSISDLKKKNNSLNNDVQKLKEKELLLLQYPDLYGPIPIQKDTDIIKDMELQIQANTYRIELLEQQNETLKSSIQRLIEADAKNHTEKPSYQQPLYSNNNNEYQSMRPIPLFKLENEINEPLNNKNTKTPSNYTWNQQASIPKIQNYNQYQINHQIADSENVFVKIETPKTTENNNYRQDFEYNNLPDNNKKAYEDNYKAHTKNYEKHDSRRFSISGSNISSHRLNDTKDSYRRNNVTPVISAPVKDMEILIGKGHRPSSASRPPSAQKSSPTSTNRQMQSTRNDKNKFICDKCNKGYNNRKDVDIHKLYCNK